jgi:diphosphomevalonate decarboxylase
MNVSLSHGKIILMGEHAVVYGYGAIALPLFSHSVTTAIEKSDTDFLDCSLYQGKLMNAPTQLNNLLEVITGVKKRLNITESLRFTIVSTIPSGRGMGSSAAVVSSVIKAMYNYKQIFLPQEQLLELVHIGETIAHGNPSGLDGVIVNSKVPVLFKRGKGIIPVQSRLHGYLVIKDTGIVASTKQAVADIGELMKRSDKYQNALDQLGKLSERSIRLIEEGNMKELGLKMTEAQKLLKLLTVSHPVIDQLVEQALDAGAYGAKLTGGGRGGCVIALCSDENIRDAVIRRWNDENISVLDFNLRKVKARAHANIALVKYWGKQNEEQVIPYNSSLSLTLDKLYTDTIIETAYEDEFILNGVSQNKSETGKIFKFADRFRQMSQRKNRIRITSVNNFPTAAGLASSASGFAALAMASNRYFNLNLSKKELSVITRFGSGSATRSLFGGFVIWQKDEIPFAYEFDSADWDIAMIVVVINKEKKDVSSKEAMRRTVLTSPYYPAWVESAQSDFEQMKKAIKKRDFTRVGQITYSNALRMHASMMAAEPPVMYMQPKTLEVLNFIENLNNKGLDCFATMDAGPNVKILVRQSQVQMIVNELSVLIDPSDMIMCVVGEGATILDES